jgi:CheY-like chemotaxis protein
MKLSGSLEKNKLSDIMREIKSEQLTGILALKSREGFGTIFFKEGIITNAYSPVFRERLGRRLVEKGLISEKELRKSLIYQKSEAGETRVGDILVKHGFISDEELNTAVKEIIQDTLYSMVFWDGIYRFEDSVVSDKETHLLIDVDEFLDGIKRSFSDLEDDFLTLEEAVEAEPEISEHDFHSDIKEEIIDSIEKITKSISSFTPQEIVILVEDEKLMRTIFTDGLKNFGYRVESFDNPTDALERIQKLEPSRISPVLIMDLVMPGISSSTEIYGGLELLTEINQNFPYIPVIVITSITDLEIRLKSLFMGASYYLNKPEKSSLSSDLLRSSLDNFVEELSLCVENLFRNKRVHYEKEQLAFIREELINELLDAKLELGSAEKEIERDIFDLTYLKKTTYDLLKKQNFSFIADTMFNFLKIDFDRGFVTVMRGGESKYYKGFSKIADDNIASLNKSPESFTLNIIDLKSFENVITHNKIFTEQLSTHDSEIIYSLLGGYRPSHSCIIPFRVYDKTIAVLYCDLKPEKPITKDIDQIQVLTNAASLAMQITILNEKIASK